MSTTTDNDTAGRPAAAARPRWRGWPLLLVLAVVMHFLFFDRGLGGDGWATFAFLSSAVDDGDLALENNSHGVMNGLLARPDGHLVMQYPPGVPLLDLAPFLAGRALDEALPAGVVPSGISIPVVGPVSRRVACEIGAIVLARNLAAGAGLWMVVLALGRLGFGRSTAGPAAALTFFGGPLVFYALVGMSHAPAFALAALLFLLLARHGGAVTGREAAAAGLIVGVATLVRLGSAALLPVALLAGWRGGRWKGVGASALGFVVPLLALPPFWRLHHGQWLPLEYGGAWRLTPAAPWNVLLAPEHGLFVFHPVLLLAFAGLVVASRSACSQRQALARLGLAWFVAVAFVNGCWSDWANPGGWGQRFMIDALPPLALGLAAVLDACRLRGALRTAAAALALFGYVLFFAAVGGLARVPDGYPWPQRLSDYRPLADVPRTIARLGPAFLRASFVGRAIFGPPPAEPAGR